MSVLSIPASQGRILGSDAAVAVGRFSALGVIGYRAKSGGPLRATRAEAENDQRLAIEALRRAAHSQPRDGETT